jgi:hypothetical protein
MPTNLPDVIVKVENALKTADVRPGFRKFIVVLFALSCTFHLCAWSRLDGGSVVAIVLGVVGAYLTANVVQSVKATPAPPIAGGG